MPQLRRTCHRLLFAPRSSGERWLIITLGALILLSVGLLMIETLPQVRECSEMIGWLFRADLLVLGIFALEYLVRVWCIVEDPRYARPVSGRLRYLCTPMALVDLIAILPGLLPFITGFDLRTLRVLRLMRMLILLRLGRYSTSLHLIGEVVSQRRGELAAVMMVVVVVLLIAATVMYHLEHETQPDIFTSIPHSMWWAVVTLTTIGYGDAVPSTGLGKVVGGMVALFGVGMVALPAGILASGLGEALQDRRARAGGRQQDKPQDAAAQHAHPDVVQSSSEGHAAMPDC